MADTKPLNDIEVYDRLHDALEKLGTAPGATVHGDTAITAARRALVLLQLGVLKSGEEDQASIKGPVEP